MGVMGGKECLFNKQCWNNQITVWDKRNLDPYLKFCTQIYLKWLIHLNVKAKIMIL